MSKGISDAQNEKERLWTESNFRSGTIKSIDLMDRDNNYCSPSNDRKKKSPIPIYGQTRIQFDDGVSATIPCTLKEAQEYHIGQKAKIELVVEDDDDE